MKSFVLAYLLLMNGSRYFSVSKPRVIEDKRKKKKNSNNEKKPDPLCFMRYVFNFETHVKR